jgi:hypothetical protein
MESPAKPKSHKFLFTVWGLDTTLFIWLFIYMFLYGSSPDTVKLAGDLGAAWGVLFAFLIVPTWRAMKQWPAPYKKFIFSGVFIIVAVVGFLFWIRARQTAKLEELLKETRNISIRGAPQKQLFVKLTRENPQTLPEYLQRSSELEPAIKDYAASEQQMDNVLAEMQNEIERLKPNGSYAGMLPMLGVLRAILGKDLEAAKVYKQEIDYAKHLPSIPEADRPRFVSTNIGPVIEQEQKIALDEVAILKDAKARGITMPANMLQDAGIK